MHRICHICLILFVAFKTGSCQEKAQEKTKGQELVYSESDFLENVGKSPHFVMFYAPWCGHCQRLTPIWSKLSEDINPNDAIDMKFAKVDCTGETKLCSDEGVLGYPTLKLYRPDQETVRYTGGRDIESLRRFAISSDESTPDAVQQEALTHNDGLYDITAESFDEHVSKGDHFIKFFAPWCGHCKRMEPTWVDLAKAHIPSTDMTEDVKIGRIDCTAHGSICSSHGVKGYPTLLWFNNGKLSKKYQGSRDLKSFETFITEMKELPRPDPESKEEVVEAPSPTQAKEPEEDKKTSAVIELEENNFDFHTAVDVTFIKFYAPWCGFCKRLAPIWDKLSYETFPGSLNVEIAKVDCTGNGDLCQKYEVQGYPTLLLFKDGEKISKFTGSRNLEDMKDFVINTINALPSQEKDEL
uniref:Thioredoxin domain-containing protein 5 n=1 Tax=Phallusia mammillata TaxID=59560 RepID=A0A6F9DVB3_9ASCI|nr:thioredoxin domain-containing protein 5 [Phallusia mammillata]